MDNFEQLQKDQLFKIYQQKNQAHKKAETQIRRDYTNSRYKANQRRKVN